MPLTKKPIHLYPIERKFIPFSEIGFGPLAGKKSLSVAFISVCFILSMLGLFSQTFTIISDADIYATILKITVICIALRLILIDLRHLVLPNIYTIPLILLGCAYNIFFTEHAWWMPPVYATIALLCFLVFSVIIQALTKGKSFLGGGDIKMIAAIAAWDATSAIPLIISLACVLTFIMLPFFKSKQNIPFGPGLCFAFIINLINPAWWHIFF